MKTIRNNFVNTAVMLFLFIVFGAKAQWTVNPNEQKCFIENKGQFDEKNKSSESIAFGVKNLGYQLYFSNDRFVLRYDEVTAIVDEEKEGEMKKDEKIKCKTKTTLVDYKWLNTSKDVRIIAEDVLPNVFNYGNKTESESFYGCKAYRKIIYKNLYNGIDLEFVFHEKTGIKYSYIVHPGADVSQIKLKYNSDVKPTLKDGKINLSVNMGEVIEEAPVTFYNDTKRPIQSDFVLKNNVVEFNLGEYDNSKTIVIDPWVIFPIMPTNNKSLEIQKDPAGNVYVYGGQNPYTVNKYSSAGVLAWTLALLPLGSTPWSGDLLVFDNNFSYASNGPGVGSTPSNIIKINNATGAIVWGVQSGTGTELFRLIHNCDKSKAIEMGGAAGGRVGDLNQITGAAVTSFLWGNAEIKSVCRAPNGNFYVLTAGAGSNRLYALNASFGTIWMIMSTYAIPYACPVYLTPGSGNGGFNGVAANNKFIYTYDGSTLIKRDICNGNFLGSTVVPSSVFSMDGGIMIDSCGSVYVGSQNGIYKYDPNLSLITSSVTPNAVYDITEGISLGEVLACGDGFATRMNLSVCDPLPFAPTCPPVLTASISNISPACNSACVGAATVTPTGTWPFEYLWAPGSQTTQAVSGLCPGTYSVYVSDRYMKLCSPVIVTITAGSTPTINATVGGTLTCSNTSVILTGTATTGGVTYSWTPLGVGTATASVSTAGSYSLTVTGAGGCSSSTVVTVTQNTTVPNASIAPPAQLTCTNSSVVLNGSSTTTGALFQWSGGPAAANYTVTSTGVYSLTVTNPPNGCTVMVTTTVTQSAGSPNISATVGGTLTCANTSVVLTGTSTTSGVTYSWTPLGVGTSTALATTAGSYTLTVTNGGCSSTTVVSVNQNTTAPNASIAAPAQITCTNNSVVLNGNSTTTGALYQWLGGPTTANYTVTSIGVYSLTVTNPVNGCTTIATTTVTQGGGTPTLTASSGGTLTCTTLTVNLNAVSAGNIITWNGGILSNASNPATVNIAGNYTVTVTNSAGTCSVTQIITVLQNTIAPNISASVNTSLTCVNLLSILSGTSTSGTVNYTWQPTNVNTSSTSVSSPGSYTLTVMNSLNGCLSNTVVSVTQNTSTPNVSVSVSNSLTCLLTSANLNGVSGTSGATFTWQPININGAVTSVSAAGIYTLIVTDPSNGCVSAATVVVTQNTLTPNISANVVGALGCISSSVSLIGNSTSGGATYTWSPMSINTATAVISAAGTYTLGVTDPINGCSNFTTISVSTTNGFTPTISLSSSVSCNGGNNGALQINISGGSGSYSITNINTGNTTSTVTSFPFNLPTLSASNYSILIIDNGSGCSQIVNATVNEPSALNVLLSGTTSVCSGQNISVNCNAIGGTGPYTYVWLPSGSTTPNLIATFSSNTNLSVTVTDNNGCKKTTPLTVTVNPLPSTQLAPLNSVGCSPVCATFSLIEMYNSQYSYQWSFSNGETSSMYDPQICFTNPGSYDASVIITSVKGCSVTANFNKVVKVFAKPIANFEFTPTNPTILESVVSFTNLSSGAGSYTWYSNNTLFSTKQHPQYSFPEAGSYLVALIASNGQCADTALRVVIVEDDFVFYAPNAFTPNGDKLNDSWFPVLSGYKEGTYDIQIFDRWGAKLYESTEPMDKGWDGIYKGDEVKDDVYVWKVSVTTNKGLHKEFSGHITLYR